MKDKEKADILIELSKLQMGKFDKSRDIEWKMNFTLWGLIVGAAAVLMGKLTWANSQEFWTYAGGISLAVFLWHFFWLIKMQVSQELDSAYYQKYREDIEGVLPHHQVSELKHKYPSCCLIKWLEKVNSTVFWPLGDALVTLFLLIVVCSLLFLTPKANDASPMCSVKVETISQSNESLACCGRSQEEF